MVPPKKSRQPRSQLDSERLQELDDWLAKTELEYREEPPEHAAQLWKAGFLDNLPDHVVSFLRFSIPLFFGHLIGRGGGSLGEVWLSPLKINWSHTALLDAYFDIGPLFTSYHVIIGLPIVFVWGWRCFTLPRIGNGLWAYWIMIFASLFVFFMMRSHGFRFYVPMILILSTLVYAGHELHSAHRGRPSTLPGADVLNKVLMTLYEPTVAGSK